MQRASPLELQGRTRPDPAVVLELLKPITWFAPMWAFMCGVVSFNADVLQRWPYVLGGVLLAGPCVCATSQAANDWFDRHVDAINEPGRPIPSGRLPGRSGLFVAFAWTAMSLLLAAALGRWAFGAAVFGLALAWLYSAPPVRLKQNGWFGNAAVGLCYEGVPWFTGVAVMSSALPDARIVVVLGLYSLGAHGIMTLNDFKSIDGDRRMGVRSIPAMLGPERAVRLACVVMALPQAIVIALLLGWGMPVHAGIVAILLATQFGLMVPLVGDPRGRAAWYNASGTSLYVLGMLAAAFALRSMQVTA